VEAIQIVQHRHIEWCSNGAFFLVPSHVYVGVVGAAVG
jgi:hypothetical protein